MYEAADHVTLNFTNNISTASVLLAINKTSDTTWHPGLIHKLREFSTSLVKPIDSFLSNGKF
jgi:hypothetical protein